MNIASEQYSTKTIFFQDKIGCIFGLSNERKIHAVPFISKKNKIHKSSFPVKSQFQKFIKNINFPIDNPPKMIIISLNRFYRLEVITNLVHKKSGKRFYVASYSTIHKYTAPNNRLYVICE